MQLRKGPVWKGVDSPTWVRSGMDVLCVLCVCWGALSFSFLVLTRGYSSLSCSYLEDRLQIQVVVFRATSSTSQPFCLAA